MAKCKCKIKCPSCKGNNLILVEHSTASGICTVEDGICDPEDLIFGERDGGDLKLRGECNECDHTWTVRKANFATDVCDEINTNIKT